MDLRQGGYTARWTGLTFVNSAKKVLWTEPKKEIFWDLDGSLTGFANGWLTPFYKWNQFEPACTRGDTTYDSGIVCDNSVVVRRLQVDYVEPRELDFKLLVLNSTAGVDSMRFRVKEFYGWALPLVAERNYQFWFNSLVDWRNARVRYSEPVYVGGSEWVGLGTNFTDFRLNYEVLYGSAQEWRPWHEERLPLPSDPTGTGAMGTVDLTDAAPNKTFAMVINSVDADSEDWFKYTVRMNALQCPRIVGCPLPPRPVRQGRAGRVPAPVLGAAPPAPPPARPPTPCSAWILVVSRPSHRVACARRRFPACS